MPKDFTPSQREAISYRQLDACVVAGPGSGKTTVLVERFRSLVEDYHFKPDEILAITFTEKAAANMKRKLAEEFASNPLALRDLETAWVSTIHGFCARLLREHAVTAGVDPRFTVLDADDAERLQHECMGRALDALVETRREEALALIEALHQPDIARRLVSVYDAIRSSGKTLAEVRAMPSPRQPADPALLSARLNRLARWTNPTPLQAQHSAELRDWARLIGEYSPLTFEGDLLLYRDRINLRRVPRDVAEMLRSFRKELEDAVAPIVDRHTAPFRALLFDVLDAFETLYRERKNARAALDFNDLERRAVELLTGHPDTRNTVRGQFRQVMLDEFQDINQQQSDLIELVRGEDVFFAVGDVNQSIYGFRHARPDIFHGYLEKTVTSGKHYTTLYDNFRSRDEILRTVEQLTNNVEGIVPRELSAAATFPPRADSAVEAWRVTAPDSDDEKGAASAREARWIAWRIATLQGTLPLAAGRAAEYRDFAILCRNSESMGLILEALDHARIPYVCGRRESFIAARECRDLTALLRIVVNPRDSISLAAVLRSPFVPVSDETLLRLRLLANSLTGGLNVVAHDPAHLTAFDSRDAERLLRFTGLLRKWRWEYAVLSLEVFLSRVLADCGVALNGNLESYLRLARSCGEDTGLAPFLRITDGLEENRNTDSDLADADQGDTVRVMTAHAAKGLEFPIVILAAMEKGVRLETDAVTFTPQTGIGVKWRSPISDKGVDDSWQTANAGAIGEREKGEAHRLFYVAMTRAGEHLILSYAKTSRSSPWTRLADTLPQLQELSYDPPEPPVRDSASEDAVPALERPAVTGQHDSTVNVTSLAVFAQCPRRYYLQRYLGWNGRRTAFDPDALPTEDDAEVSASELGSLVHSLLAGKPGEYPEEARSLAAVFEGSELGRAAAASRQSAREWDFILDLDGILVQGVIDLWFEDPSFEDDGGIVVVDYKTDSHVDPAAYAPQLALYALALERATGRTVAGAFLHFLRFGRVVEVPVGPEAIAAVRELAARLAGAQDTLQFPLNPDISDGGHCHSCPLFRGLCPFNPDSLG